ncbi:DUF4148 domain-containing protein [Burkholderia seminalis]|uniref:DUF4148 domain-containing protein n=1 Tax=Burkholderia cenocepacia TaxID=95486 RepID=A0A071ML98_9BURK|nr:MULTISPECIES: DUF4148 domain-containing protein [Burkholderia]AOJ28144.1 hypothetical protein WJ12_24945 [Burkholderia seminalis]KVF47534.1 hypothetical protein WJ13_19615 [Burkholderia seminalis]MBJ9592774.1 DUF4148 domain-containing protein [Burkholderia seminalis]MBJ9962863.1 DUF4148 domain-containing protein [Burkholderia seminalis]MBN3738375.1 DUF4148 domain-containing protein [Burkholderia sp. Tr-20355]
MKSLIATFAAAAVLAVPAVSFAQNAPVTRAQVKADLVAVQQAGYKLGSDRTNYPEGIQAAEARLNPQQNVAAADTTGYGAQPAAAQESGAPAAAKTGWQVKRIADGAPVYKGR